jgi:hypothetical protein
MLNDSEYTSSLAGSFTSSTGIFGGLVIPCSTGPAMRGSMYYDLQDTALKVYNGSSWIIIGPSV